MSYLSQRERMAREEVAKQTLPKGYYVLLEGQTVKRGDLLFSDGRWATTLVYGTSAGLDGAIYARLASDNGGLVG